MTTETEEVEFTVDSIPQVDEGTYPGKLIGMRKFSYDTPEGESRTLIEWKFHAKDADGNPLTDNEGQPLELSGVTSMATGPMSKWFEWTVALLGAAAVNQPGAHFKASDMVGKQALLTIGPDKKGYPKVQKLTALPRSRGPVPVAAPTVPDEAAPNFDDLPF